MAKFQKKPVVIDAVQWVGDVPSARAVSDLVRSAVPTDVKFVGDGLIHINTLEGVMTASLNDWIIKGVKGELYPCKPDIFAATYDPA